MHVPTIAALQIVPLGQASSFIDTPVSGDDRGIQSDERTQNAGHDDQAK